MWKQRFTAALKAVLSAYSSAPCEGPRQIYENFIRIPKRGGLWGQVADVLNILPQEAHDYFHNTWTRQVFDDFAQHKHVITQIVTRNQEQCASKNELTNLVVAELKARFPDQRFHKLALGQFVHHLCRRKRERTAEEEEEPDVMQFVQFGSEKK